MKLQSFCYLNIANIIRRCIPTKRDIKFWFQRRVRGWDDGETFSLDYSLAHVILPRLKRFRELTIGTPHNQTEQEWKDKLDQMIAAFEFVASEDYWLATTEDYERHQNGFNLFAEHYTNLWW